MGWEVYVAPFPGPGGKWQVSTAGGLAPRWQADGKTLFYRDAQSGRLMAAAVRLLPSGFEVGEITPMFPVIVGGTRSFYDVSPDGRQILVNTPLTKNTGTIRPLTVVMNWTASVKK